MIGAVKNILTSSNLANIAQNTNASVTIETGLKAIFVGWAGEKSHYCV